ncbi:minor capsid protein [Oceanobacillus alkalisoli]|uniref:minor capsid protein n=1 Tax=Oceanobacillus alkalisoli TaxID=2925113 RepID=UPI001F11D626|nr:minor capsid protein [Oceanobacillus alkalisoli]MCF3942209.1 minor capsid protein [Oceanobacillus alkalisoli]
MVKVNVNLSGVYKKMENQNVDRGRYAVANQALADMNPFVPMLEGITRQTATIDIDGTGINYNTPYSAELFYMPKMNYTTPGTGPRWDNKAKGMFMSDWINAFLKGAGW